MAMGKAVVGTRVVGIEDYVEDGVTGLLTPPGDADAMRLAMQRLLDDPAEAARMGIEGFDRLNNKFTDRAMGSSWEILIVSLLENGSGESG